MFSLAFILGVVLYILDEPLSEISIDVIITALNY